MHIDHPSERRAPSERELFVGRKIFQMRSTAIVAATREEYPFLALAALAATAGGAGMNIAAQEQARSAVQSAQNAEAKRQSDYQKKAGEVFQQSLAKSGTDTANQEIEQGAQKRLAGYTDVNSRAGAPVAAPATSFNRIVTPVVAPGSTFTATQAATADAWNRILGNAQSRAGGYADWALNQNARNNRAREKLGVLGSSAAGSAHVSQLEAERASHAGDSMAGIGNLLGAAGSVAGYWGATQPVVQPGLDPSLVELGYQVPDYNPGYNSHIF